MEIKEIFDLVIKWAVPVVCVAILGFIKKTTKSVKDISDSTKKIDDVQTRLDTIDDRLNCIDGKLDINTLGTQELLGDKIDYYHEKKVENGDGTISHRDYNKVCRMYDVYVKQHGNGERVKEVEELKNLHIKG